MVIEYVMLNRQLVMHYQSCAIIHDNDKGSEIVHSNLSTNKISSITEWETKSNLFWQTELLNNAMMLTKTE